MEGNGLLPSGSSPTWGNSRTENLPPLRLFRIKALEKEETIVDIILVEKKEAQEDDFLGLLELFEGLESIAGTMKVWKSYLEGLNTASYRTLRGRCRR